MDRRPARFHFQYGFNLIEVMVAISIISILLSIGIPSYVDSQKRNNADSNILKMKSAINEAKQLAIYQARDMVICPPNAAVNACGNQWSRGVIIFARSDANQAANSFNGITSSEIISRIYGVESSVGSFSAAIGLGRNYIAFDSNGFTSQAGSITYCDVSNSTLGRRLAFNVSGQITLADFTCP